MPETLSAQHIREIATAPRPTWADAAFKERISRHIVRSEGFAESSAWNFGRGVYALFDEMEEKDAHLYSLLQTRKNGVLARPRRIEPASDRTADQAAAEWLKGVFARIPNLDGALLHLLDAMSKGMAVVEVIWGYDAGGRAVPVELKPRNAGRFCFAPDGSLALENDPLGGAVGVERTGSPGDANRERRFVYSRSPNGAASSGAPFAAARRLPERKFLVMLFGATDDRPFGRGLCERVYWYWWFKKNNLKFWVLYNEKFGAPTVIARHSPGLSPVERDRLLDVISGLQADAGVTLPEGIDLELLESARRGSADTYRNLADWCNDEMARAVLGQTLTSGEGRRGGSFALARVHEAVRFDYIRTDACLLMDVLNHQLIRWIVDFNFGEKFPSPRWTIDLSPEIEPEVEVSVDRQLLQMGVPLPLRYFYRKYGRPSPGEGERRLRYDDNNLFQYHLQFGVLTVNEVRASLGLSPVAWGDQPTSPAAEPAAPPTPIPAAGGAPFSREDLGDFDEAEREGDEAKRERDKEK